MSKMLKAVAMILIIAAVVFVAGCANKEAPANNTTTTSEDVNKSEVTPVENNTSADNMSAETPAIEVNTTDTNTTETNVAGNISENNTSVPAEHKSITQLNKEKILANANNSTSQ